MQKGRLEAKIQAYKISTQSEQDVLAEEVCLYATLMCVPFHERVKRSWKGLAFCRRGTAKNPHANAREKRGETLSLTCHVLFFQVAKREEAIHKLKIEKLALQEQQQKAEDNVCITVHLPCFVVVFEDSVYLSM